MRELSTSILRWSPSLEAWCLWVDGRVTDFGPIEEMRERYPSVWLHVTGRTPEAAY